MILKEDPSFREAYCCSVAKTMKQGLVSADHIDYKNCADESVCSLSSAKLGTVRRNLLRGSDKTQGAERQLKESLPLDIEYEIFVPQDTDPMTLAMTAEALASPTAAEVMRENLVEEVSTNEDMSFWLEVDSVKGTQLPEVSNVMEVLWQAPIAFTA